MMRKNALPCACYSGDTNKTHYSSLLVSLVRSESQSHSQTSFSLNSISQPPFATPAHPFTWWLKTSQMPSSKMHGGGSAPDAHHVGDSDWVSLRNVFRKIILPPAKSEVFFSLLLEKLHQFNLFTSTSQQLSPQTTLFICRLRCCNIK